MSEWTERWGPITDATRRGEIAPASKMKCEDCGVRAVHRHHEDYAKPLEVAYLCHKCHKRRHKKLGWGESGRPRFYNFSQIQVGSFARVLGTVGSISPVASLHGRRTGERFKCITFDKETVVVFRLPDRQPANKNGATR